MFNQLTQKYITYLLRILMIIFKIINKLGKCVNSRKLKYGPIIEDIILHVIMSLLMQHTV